MLEVERLNLLSQVNSRKDNFDSPQHVADFYSVVASNLGMEELHGTIPGGIH